MTAPQCSVDHCSNVVKCRSLCRAHHEADLATRRAAGEITGRITADPPFERLVRRHTIDENGCWLWTGQLSPDGYGLISVNSQKRGAHAVAWEMLVEPIPDGLEIDHLCNVRHCVNPDHLEPVTHTENMRRAALRRAAA